MELRKFVACTVCAVTTAFSAAGCADVTGQALTPTLPSVDASASNADGTKLKATPPQPLSPQSAVRITTLTPQLVLRNGAGSFEPSASLSYVYEVFEVDGSIQTLVIKSEPISAGSGQTTWTVPANTLKMNKTYAWRSYAIFSGVQGSLSDGVSFRTPLPAPVVADGPGPVPCGGSSGPSIIGCVGAAYPSKLVAKVSVPTRIANMEFIRDRIIETGICKGQDFGRNFKRGTPVLSADYLIERRPGQRDRGVDLASGYDDVSGPLKLTWQVKGPPDYGFPFYAKYPAVDCSGVT
jgi:hypothetical protein